VSGALLRAGVPGFEPRLTEPESVVLPITPYPNGTPPDVVPGKNTKPYRDAADTRGPLPRNGYADPPELAHQQLRAPVESCHHRDIQKPGIRLAHATAVQPDAGQPRSLCTTRVGRQLLADVCCFRRLTAEFGADPLKHHRVGFTHPEFPRDRDVVEVPADTECRQFPVLVAPGG